MQPTTTIDLVLDRQTARDVLHAVLHAVLFHRLFGTVKPRTIDIYDVTLPGVQDPEIERLIEEKVNMFWKSVENGTNKRGQISVTLSDKRQKKGFFWQVGEEDVPWEEWLINADIRQPKTDLDRQAFNTSLSSTLTDVLNLILTSTSSESGRAIVPPIRESTGISPFRVSIQVKVAGVEVG